MPIHPVKPPGNQVSTLSTANGIFSLGAILAVLFVMQYPSPKNPVVGKLLLAYSFIRPDQITVTAITFPVAGDRLYYARISNPGLTELITPPGGNQNWDLSKLKAETTFETRYRPASEGMNFSSFPGANLVSSDSSGESYYNATSTKFDLVGQSGGDLAALGVKANYNYLPPLSLRTSPVNFFDIKQQSSNVSLSFAIKDLPASLVQNIQGINQADSLRMRIAYQVLSVYDAWGTMTIPGSLPQSQYQVLREKSTSYTSTAIDIHTFLGWLDASSFVGSSPLSGFIGTDTTVRHKFLSNKEKEDIVVLELNNEQSAVRSVHYKNNLATTPVTDQKAKNLPGVKAFPNPSKSWVYFDCTALPKGEYRLHIYNLIGIEYLNRPYHLIGTKSIKLDLTSFKSGTYLYGFEDQNGNLTTFSRMVIAK